MSIKRFSGQIMTALALFIIAAGSLTAQPAGYYNGTEGLNGTQLRSALHNIIKNHNSLTYGDLWDAFTTTDKKTNGKVWDMYSDVPGGTPPYQYTFGSDQCGNYNGEGDCYNREHSWPKSWFNDNYPMYSDLFHLYPTDGYVNGKRSNYPYGEVGSSSWTSQNGSKVGNNTYPGNSETVFEPIDAYKGDFARTYFYMCTRYYTEDAGWENNGMINGANLKAWAQDMLIEWHHSDPVSPKETDRNNAVYAYQNNRNPFIDHPEFADKIWGDPATSTSIKTRLRAEIFPNPCVDQLMVTVPENQPHMLISLSAVNGQLMVRHTATDVNQVILNVAELPQGLYLIEVTAEGGVFRGKLIKTQ